MNAGELLAELGANLGIALQLGKSGTCRVHFDEDEVDFEQSGDALYIMADLASASGRADACVRLLEANWLGRESGGACFGIDAEKTRFTLHTVVYGDTTYADFEARLTLFIKALRYWKAWLSLPPSSPAPADSAKETPFSSLAAGMLRV